jgi:hypothetical protein
MTKRYFLYVIKHVASGTKYIGQTFRPHRRWCEHKQYARNGSKVHRHLYAAMRKHGIENFDFRIVGRFERDAIDAAEAGMIAACREMGDRLYNTSPGGGRGDVEAANRAGVKRLEEIKLNEPTRYAEIQAKRAAAFAKVNDERGEDGRRANAKNASAALSPEARTAITWTNNFLRSPEDWARCSEAVATSNRRRALNDPATKAAEARKRLETLGPAGLAAIGRKSQATLGPEGRAARAKKAAMTAAARSVEDKAATLAKWRAGNAARLHTPEQQVEARRIKSARTVERRQPLVVLGFRSNAEMNAWLAGYKARRSQSSQEKEHADV